MIFIYHSIALIAAYFIGAIPSSILIGKYFYNTDVREHGSKNAGATNTFRVLGKKPGIIVLIMDILKGWLVTNIAYLYAPPDASFINFQLSLGVQALIGHIFPIYVGFKGGKGIATAIGLIIAIAPIPVLISFIVFSIVLIISNYVSLGSIISGICFSLIILLSPKYNQPALRLFAAIIPVVIIITHHKNIQRLFKGEENKMKVFKSKN